MTLARSLATLGMVVILSGCSTLPRDGPAGRVVDRNASSFTTAGSYTIVELTYAASELIRSAPTPFLGSLSSAGGAGDSGLIGIGDTLSVAIFEPGGSLFGTLSSPSSSVSTAARSNSQTLPGIVVDSGGRAFVPFAGEVDVAGLTTGEASMAIRRALSGKAANPQVVVAIADNSSNNVTVLGEVREPGRAPLTANADRILDVIANRGGVSRSPEDVVVVIHRGGQQFSAPFSVISSQNSENIALSKGDQINLIYRPRRFSTFGALGSVSQTDIGPGVMTLAAALSKASGLDTNSANARSVLVFRFERPEVASALNLRQPATARGTPTVYRLDLEQPEGFFTASNFEIQPDDIIYVPRSGSAELGKFFTLIRTISGVIYDVSVTNSLTRD